MAVQYLHGLETLELNDGLRPIQTVKSSIIGIVGWAPDADNDLFPLNTPVALFADPSKAQRLGAAGSLLDAVNAVYSQGSATVVVVRVAGASMVEAMANAVGSVTAKTGVWALLKARPMLGLIPKILIAPGVDQARPTNGLVSAVVGVQGSGYTQSATKVVFAAAPSGGRTATGTVQVVAGKVTGVTITDPGFGYVTAPAATITGDGTNATVTAALGGVANPVAKALEAVAPKLRAVALVNGPATTYEAAVAYRRDFGTQRVMVIDPGLQVFDPATQSVVTKPASAYAAGIQARIDKERGFWHSFSNEEILNVLGPSRPVDFMYSDADCEANQLNANQITTIINDGGIRFWGLRGTSTDPLWAFLSVRRTADMIYESMEQAHRPFLDRPFSYALLDVIQESINAYLRQLRSRGAIINGTCTIDPSVNTKDTFVNGELIVDFDIEPPAPLEHLTFRVRRNPSYYSDFIEQFAAQITA